MTVKFGDPAPTRRFGVSVSETPGDHSERTLGPAWPKEFSASYQPGSFVGRLGTARANALKVTQRLHNQIQEVRTAKALGKAANIPDVNIRRQRARQDQQALAEINATRNGVDKQAFEFRHKLQLHDFSQSTAHEINLRNRYLDKLASAKNDSERLKLMQSDRGYRLAAFQGHHSLSGLSEEVYNRAYEQELKTIFPTEMQTLADHSTADDILRHVCDAARVAVENELKAIGEPISEAPTAAEPQPWE